ncbi:glycoside hydrolase family 88/105 protein [Sphingobacterium humi]|uniref:Glycoside hydrolase family 88 protein n=1 Tax=Sphingobacterium humi TaxID=1796905 RepID=A0A6N8KXG6_9SPHI|nr:glycoside hydrolase family 88 protein [Sphingobacterium humi]MVZ60598.1 glycoside hydrolase family 88 protein [Sphingobacterium humi]
MKRDLRYNLMACLLLAGFLFSACASKKGPASTQISKEEVLKQMQLANSYFMQKWPDTGKPIYTTRWRPSNIWTRAVYYEGLMDLYKIDPNKKYYDYAVAWGENHDWNLRNGIETRNADDQACGQIYLDLYEIDPQPERLAAIKANIDGIIESKLVNDWTWIDAIQMAMPVFAKLGVMYKDESYFNAMHQFYLYSRNVEGGGLYNAEDDLWWRDKDFVPPYKEPNGEDCYWSRGNGWVVAAYVRVLDLLPKDHAYAAVYRTDFKNMMKALLACQRPDGFWNVSLHDPNHFGGAETSGTALFVYGMAWGIQHGLLDEATYREPMERAWQAIAQQAIHPSGFLGYVQGTGKEPKDGQPVSFSSIPDFEDYGLGCFLLAGTAYYNYLASK